MWPASILAANLIAKLNILIKYEKISIGIKRNNNKKGDCGIKIRKNFKFWTINPITKIETHKLNDTNNIKIIWLVNAIPNGNKLIILHKNIKLKITKIKGK